MKTSVWEKWAQTRLKISIIYFIYMNKKDLALNDQKIKPNPTKPRAPNVLNITVNFVFHGKYYSFSSLSFISTLWSARIGNTINKPVHFFLLITTRSGFIDNTSLFHLCLTILWLIISDWCWFVHIPLSQCSNISPLHSFQWIAFLN